MMHSPIYIRFMGTVYDSTQIMWTVHHSTRNTLLIGDLKAKIWWKEIQRGYWKMQPIAWKQGFSFCNKQEYDNWLNMLPNSGISIIQNGPTQTQVYQIRMATLRLKLEELVISTVFSHTVHAFAAASLKPWHTDGVRDYVFPTKPVYHPPFKPYYLHPSRARYHSLWSYLPNRSLAKQLSCSVLCSHKHSPCTRLLYWGQQCVLWFTPCV